MSYNAELQMLREFYLLIAPRIMCYFCNKPIVSRKEGQTFGHRRHTKVWELIFTTHHDDGDRDNNNDSNLKACHSTCHRRYERQLLLKGGPLRGNEKETRQEEGR